MATNKELRITELDFEAIKRNFRSFLKRQDQFTDYDFDASGMDVLLDIFAYNTHYNAFYMNAAVNETFLATANSRQNIVKRAQSLNYVPKSFTAATAYVDIQIEVPEDTLISVFGSSNYGIVQLGKNTRFITTIDNTKYTFINPQAVTLTQQSSTTFTANRVMLRQGIPNTFRYTVDSSNDFQRYVIPNENVDTTTLSITSLSPDRVDSTHFVYHKEVNLQSIRSDTPIYFLLENASELFEVEFGDGKYGYKPVNNEVISLEYLVTAGKIANGAKNFTASSNVTLSGNIINNATVSITASERAFGGADKEKTESIRYNAPKYFQSQDRAIVPNDYSALIKNQYPVIESINVWGGEQNNPPKYGRVYICAKPFGSLYFTESEKTQIEDSIREKMVSAIRPEMVDAKYTYIVVNSNVKFDSKKTLKRISDLKTEITDRVLDFSQENLEKFLTIFRYSRFVDLIDETDDSILSNDTKIRLKKEFTPELNIAKAYTFYFQNSIYYPYSGFKSSITSSTFTYNGFPDCSIRQNDSGGLSIVSTPSGGIENVVVEDAGEVDYENGAVLLRSFAPDSLNGSSAFVSLYMTPDVNDIESYQEFILRIQEYDLVINVTDITNESTLTNSLSARSQASSVTVDISSTAF